MNHTNPRIERLKEMLHLEGQRQELQGQLDSIVEKIIGLKDSLFSEEAPAAPVRAAAPAAAAPVAKAPKAAKVKAPKAPKAPAKSGRAPRGSLKEQVIAILNAAGAAGVYVTEVAQQLNTKPANIHAWFHAAVKRYPEVQKIEGGHYRIAGKGAAPAAAKAPAANAATSAKAKPAAKTANGRAPRGELSSRMLAALEAAGAKGTTVSALSEGLGVPYKNVSIWFATTGKRNRSVKKIGRAQYKLVG